MSDIYMKQFISKITPKEEPMAAPVPLPLPIPTEAIQTPVQTSQPKIEEKKEDYIETDMGNLYKMFKTFVEDQKLAPRKRRKPARYISEADSSSDSGIDSDSDSEPKKIKKSKSYYKRKYKQTKKPKDSYNPQSQQEQVLPKTSKRGQLVPPSLGVAGANAQGTSSARLTVNAGNLPLRRRP